MKAIPTAILGTWLALGLVSTNNSAARVAPASWNQKAAAAYLDRRAAWWIAWPASARDQGTFCISCHTALPYALARPALRAAMDETSASDHERELLNSVTKRVRLWKQVEAFYTDQYGGEKKRQSRGTESVLNALILANSTRASDLTRTALQNMWELQETSGDGKGAWPWLDFGNEPFEAKDSVFYGASLAAIAVGTSPESMRATPGAQIHVKLLQEYLRREYAGQSLINQAMMLWASAKLPGLLTSKQQAAIIDAVLSKQQADGGWSLGSMAWTWKGTSARSLIKLWTRSEYPLLESKSDGYATGLIAFALQQADLPRENVHLHEGLAWLRSNQNPADGRWPGYSLNHRRDASSGTGLFMSDAATAFAVLALTYSGTS